MYWHASNVILSLANDISYGAALTWPTGKVGQWNHPQTRLARLRLSFAKSLSKATTWTMTILELTKNFSPLLQQYRNHNRQRQLDSGHISSHPKSSSLLHSGSTSRLNRTPLHQLRLLRLDSSLRKSSSQSPKTYPRGHQGQPF